MPPRFLVLTTICILIWMSLKEQKCVKIYLWFIFFIFHNSFGAKLLICTNWIEESWENHQKLEPFQNKHKCGLFFYYKISGMFALLSKRRTNFFMNVLFIGFWKVKHPIVYPIKWYQRLMFLNFHQNLKSLLWIAFSWPFDRGSRLYVHCKRVILKNFAKLTGKYLRLSHFNKNCRSTACEYIEKGLHHKCFLDTLAEFFRWPPI